VCVCVCAHGQAIRILIQEKLSPEAISRASQSTEVTLRSNDDV